MDVGKAKNSVVIRCRMQLNLLMWSKTPSVSATRATRLPSIWVKGLVWHEWGWVRGAIGEHHARLCSPQLHLHAEKQRVCELHVPRTTVSSRTGVLR